MKKFLALIALAAFSMTAFAHGPTPYKSDQSIVVKAEPAKAWAMVKDFGNVHAWMPTVASTKVTKKGKDTLRVISLKNGGKVTERLKSINDEDMKIKWEFVTGAPLSNYNAYISVKAGPKKGESTIRFFQRYYRYFVNNPPIPEGQDDAAAIKFVTETYEPGLENLKKVLNSSK
ncbi:MAG: SRPBCC family protein [Methylophilaceae bacterium]